MPINQLSLTEYYPWRKKTETRCPWERQYLNWEFLNYEKIRIQALQKWYNNFIKANTNTKLEPASFYVVPLELSPTWRASIAEYGGFKYVGLSALFNSSQVLVVGLIPYSEKSPKQYHPIEITSSKRINLLNRKMCMVAPVLIIDDWIPLKSDQIYVDVPYEKRIIHKILNETLINDNQISLSFQSPVLSAPRVEGSIGGISLSSISINSTFARELVKTIQLIAPPEYRTLSPPKMAHKGHKFELLNGIKFQLAERPQSDDNILSGICAKQYTRLEKELSFRNVFNGEFSIFSTLSPDEGSVSQQWNLLLKKFTETEITIPENIDEFIFSDVDLTVLKSMINEDLWIQVVHSRQHNPGITTEVDQEFNKIIRQLKQDFDALLSDIHRKERSREHLVRSMMFNSEYNLKRIAQSLARADEKNELDAGYLRQARNLIVDNFSGLISHQEFRNIVTYMEKNKADSRYSVVQTELINHPRSNLLEIYESIKSTKLFDDIYDLESFLDWLHKKGYVIPDINSKYTWV